MVGLENPRFDKVDVILDQVMESEQPLHPQQASLRPHSEPMERGRAIRTAQIRRRGLFAQTSRAPRQLSRVR